MSDFNETMNRLSLLAQLLEKASATGREVGVSWPAEGAGQLAQDINYMIRYAQHGHIAEVHAARENIESHLSQPINSEEGN